MHFELGKPWNITAFYMFVLFSYEKCLELVQIKHVKSVAIIKCLFFFQM
jgi:hypothetical protein